MARADLRPLSALLGLRRQRRAQTIATLGVVIMGPILAIATFLIFGPFDQGSSSRALRVILLTDLVYVLGVAALVMQRIVRVIASRRRQSAGSRLHMRLTGAFAIMAFMPAVTIAIFAGLTINIGMEGWFSDRVRSALGNSVAAAEAYESEHIEDLEEDIRLVASSIERARASFQSELAAGELRRQLTVAQTNIQRGLREAFIVDGQGDLLARGDRSYLFDFERPTPEQIQTANEAGIVIIRDLDQSELRALVPLRNLTDRYVYVSRVIDANIFSLLDETRKSASLYSQLENDRGRRLFEYGLIYIGFALILILAAIWMGLWFAERLSRPVGRLASAAQRVGAGDLDVQVLEEAGDDEIAMLGRYFNQMTRQLKGQRQTLIDNTTQIERRQRLFNSVLSSVTSAVVGLDAEGQITFANPAARALLGWQDAHRAVPLNVAIPEFAELFESLRDGNTEVAQQELKVTRSGKLENLLVRFSKRRASDGDLEGYVVAFDDVTDLVTAQRTAAWGDVARRIAHEIKNPLTPIQLSAERIKRKYAPKLGDESDNLMSMTDVIVRQTEDLRRIVDEFSKFARMPEPERRVLDLAQILRDAAILQESGQPNVTFETSIPDGIIPANLDATMITQALTNLIKNAGEAIESYEEKNGSSVSQPRISISLELLEQDAQIRIADNGIGLPQDRTRLFEPYVTTRDKGTGLGLPIVKKIIEEHGGALALLDAPVFDGNTHHGAMAEITLPILPRDTATTGT